MMFDFRKIFSPTADEQIEQYEQLLALHNKHIGYCSACAHYKLSQMPGFVEDHGDCDLMLPCFSRKVVSQEHIDCLYYKENTAQAERLKQKIENLKKEKV